MPGSKTSEPPVKLYLVVHRIYYTILAKEKLFLFMRATGDGKSFDKGGGERYNIALCNESC